jgi:two-component system sensor histidine kinase MprB
VRLLAAPARAQDTSLAVVVGTPLDDRNEALEGLLLLLLIGGPVALLLASLAGYGVAAAALRPVESMRREAAEVSDAEPGRRLPVPAARDEVGRLGETLIAMLARLEAAFARERTFVADASHELRTPIASLRANIQVLEDAERLPAEEREALRADIVGELDELTALVADVVELARGAKPDDEVDDVRLDLVVDSIVERASRRAGNGVEFDMVLEPTVVSGQPERIARAVSNLIDNARKWSPPGATIEVRLRDGELVVRDRGPGFEEKDLPHVFDRFFRSERARATSGSGLGLAIVRQAAESRGGTAEAANAPGGGAVVRVRFGPAGAPGETLTEVIHEP